jgi:hypothetical protein
VIGAACLQLRGHRLSVDCAHSNLLALGSFRAVAGAQQGRHPSSESDAIPRPLGQPLEF